MPAPATFPQLSSASSPGLTLPCPERHRPPHEFGRIRAQLTNSSLEISEGSTIVLLPRSMLHPSSPHRSLHRLPGPSLPVSAVANWQTPSPWLTEEKYISHSPNPGSHFRGKSVRNFRLPAKLLSTAFLSSPVFAANVNQFPSFRLANSPLDNTEYMYSMNTYIYNRSRLAHPHLRTAPPRPGELWHIHPQLGAKLRFNQRM